VFPSWPWTWDLPASASKCWDYRYAPPCLANISFLRPNNIPYFVYWSLTGHLVCFPILALVNNAIRNGCTNMCLQSILNFFWWMPRSGMIQKDLMITLTSVLWGNTILFSKVAVSRYLPINIAQQFQCLHILSITPTFLNKENLFCFTSLFFLYFIFELTNTVYIHGVQHDLALINMYHLTVLSFHGGNT
jgi:hypothetical protein